MSAQQSDDRWAAGDAYESFMGRWSRKIAERFVDWLGPEPGLSWLDIGCGTGALASAISGLADPSLVVACDRSEAFVEHARAQITDPRVTLVVAESGDLPHNPGGFDRVVSGLVLNFLPHPVRAVEEMRERTRRGGSVSAYVWDYAGRMEFLRYFWDEVVALDAPAQKLDEGVRFPLCQPGELEKVFREAGLEEVGSDALEIETHFESFSDYWRPFLGGTGPAPSYVASLSKTGRRELRNRLERRLAATRLGTVDLVARAWVARGTVA